MAEISKAYDQAEAVAVPAQRVDRMEVLLRTEGWQWFMGKMEEREKDLVEKACDIKQSEEVNRVARYRLDELRKWMATVRVEHESASRDLKQVIHENDPSKPKEGPIL